MKARLNIWGWLLVIVLIFFCGAIVYLVASESLTQASVVGKASMVTTTAGLGDKSFNDSAFAGLQRAGAEFGIDTQVYETTQPSDYEPLLIQAPFQGSHLSFAIGFSMEDALVKAAAQVPQAKYAIVDTVVDAPNVVSLVFKEEEGSYLVGVIAGLMSETNQVGFIGGVESPLIKKFQVGYQAGVMTVSAEARTLVNYAGTFGDPGKGKEIALSQYQSGADVIYHASGGTGLGMFQAARELGPDHWCIGVDDDQFDEAPQHVLTSMIKRVDVAVYDTIDTTLIKDKYTPGTVVLGLKEGGVGLAPTTGNNTPQEIIDVANAYAEMIIAGEFVVPATEEELANWTPPSYPPLD